MDYADHHRIAVNFDCGWILINYYFAACLNLLDEAVILVNSAAVLYLNDKAKLLVAQCTANDPLFERNLIQSALQHIQKQKFESVDLDQLFGIANMHRSWKIFPIESMSKKESVFFLIGSNKDQTVNLYEQLGSLQNDIKTILDFFPGKLYWKDLNSCYLGANQEWLSLVGRSSIDEIIGKTDEVFFGADKAEALRENDQWVIKTGKVLIQEESVRLETGEVRYFLATKSPRYDACGNIAGVIGNSIDITNRKKLEEEIIEVKASEERFKAMSVLGDMIAHELRTHFAALRAAEVSIRQSLPALIDGYDLSLQAGNIKEPIRRDRLVGLKTVLSDIQYSINYAQSIIDNIFAGFRHTSSTPVLEGQFFILSEAVKEGIERYPLHLEQASRIDNRCTDSVLVAGEPTILVHVVQNLLKNALQAIDKAGKGKITLESTCKDDTATLIFSDTAMGIKPEDLDRIFEVFYTTKHKDTRSLGLGLYFCKTALKRMGGNITCQSKLGEYTRFYITLSLKKSFENS